MGLPQGGKEGFHILRRIPGAGVPDLHHNLRILSEGGKRHLAAMDERQAAGARHIRPELSLFEVLLQLQVGLRMKQTGGEERGPKRSQCLWLRKGRSLPLHRRNRRLPLLLCGGRRSVPLRMTVVVLDLLDLLRSGVPQLA
jgi:hypothetical protein